MYLQLVYLQIDKMIKSYLDKELGSLSSQLHGISCPQARQFVSSFKFNRSALDHFSVEELLKSPDLWLVGTDEAKKRDEWLQEVYPLVEEQDQQDIVKSILVCSGCKQRKVDYYQKQTRGADEPMTCFCHCLNCGKRWVQ